MNLGRLGVWYAPDRLEVAEIAPFLATVEGLGYSAFWYPESTGHESFSIAGYMLGKTSKLLIGSSIANIYARDSFTARAGLRSLSALYGDRFVLGLGVSHVPLVRGVRGHEYGKPVPTMRAYLDGITRDQEGADTWPIAIAALGPLMLKLAHERTRGALPYNVTPEHTARAKAILGPDRWLAVEQKVCLETDPAKARALGRAELARYMPMTNYRNAWFGMGFTEADLENGGSDGFIDQMVLWGDAAMVRAKVRAHFDAGATHVCIQPVNPPGDAAGRDATLRTLADI